MQSCNVYKSGSITPFCIVIIRGSTRDKRELHHAGPSEISTAADRPANYAGSCRCYKITICSSK